MVETELHGGSQGSQSGQAIGQSEQVRKQVTRKGGLLCACFRSLLAQPFNVMLAPGAPAWVLLPLPPAPAHHLLALKR